MNLTPAVVDFIIEAVEEVETLTGNECISILWDIETTAPPKTIRDVFIRAGLTETVNIYGHYSLTT